MRLRMRFSKKDRYLEENARLIRKHFDREYYLQSNPDVLSSGMDPLEHYLKHGWKEGRNPTRAFSTKKYIESSKDLQRSGLNPFAHHIKYSKSLRPTVLNLSGAEQTLLNRNFDAEFYLESYPDVRAHGVDPLEHYLTFGWKEGRDPTPEFSTAYYSRVYRDVAESGKNPFLHYLCLESAGSHRTKFSRPHLHISEGIERYSETEIFSRAQDLMFPLSYEAERKLMVIVVPEHNEMSGGIYSMFSIAAHARKTRQEHGYAVVLMTNPNNAKHTYLRQKNFKNSEDVFRFEQIIYCSQLRELYLHIPEYATAGFLDRCTEQTLKFLLGLETLHINILNQNIRLMPSASKFSALRKISTSLTQSVAHHAYFTQEIADEYSLPTLLLPAYTDLTSYSATAFTEKENLIIYSPDTAEYKRRCLSELRAKLPNYRLVEICNMTFDYYMELARRCRFSISFGEGFDGYVAQPIYMGGIGLAVYNDEFFPSSEFSRLPNFFSSADDMVNKIVPVIRMLDSDRSKYEQLNRHLLQEYESLYSFSDYLSKIGQLMRRDFELSPSKSFDAKRQLLSN